MSTTNNLPLGIRNNNPLNIRKSANAWQGKTESDNAFEKFIAMKYGIRAGVKNLQTYYNRDRLTSVSKIINKWAPPIENHTVNYIAYVAKAIGVDKDATLPYTTDTFSKLVSSMSEMENGKNHGISVDTVKSVILEFNLLP